VSDSAANTLYLYCPDCGFRVKGAAAITCPDCGRQGLRIWRDPDGKPPPEDVDTIVKRGTGM
jgi:DNA-directed RNA polymerase subunit RPC12/RpoP